MSTADRPSLPPCPRSPNCVSSRAESSARRVEPLPLDGEPADGWRRLRAAVSSLPRTRILEDDGRRLRATCRTAVLRFTDDLEAVLDEERGVIDVRSASRVGWSDLGVNRRRVERLRRAFDAAR